MIQFSVLVRFSFVSYTFRTQDIIKIVYGGSELNPWPLTALVIGFYGVAAKATNRYER